MSGNVCPSCNSTDIAHRIPPKENDDGKDAICLDCDFTWTDGGRHKRDARRYARNSLLRSNRPRS